MGGWINPRGAKEAETGPRNGEKRNRNTATQ